MRTFTLLAVALLASCGGGSIATVDSGNEADTDTDTDADTDADTDSDTDVDVQCGIYQLTPPDGDDGISVTTDIRAIFTTVVADDDYAFTMAGITGVSTLAGDGKSATFSPDAALVINALLRYKSVDEVVANYTDAKENVAIAQTYADKDGGLATIEFNAKQFTGNIVFRPKSGEHFIAHTNHPKLQEQYLADTWFGGDKGKANRMLARTIWRLENAENFLATSADKKPEELKTLFRSHPVLFASSDGLDFRTTASVIWDIPKQTAYIAPDRPDLVEYQRVTWFGK